MRNNNCARDVNGHISLNDLLSNNTGKAFYLITTFNSYSFALHITINY